MTTYRRCPRCHARLFHAESDGRFLIFRVRMDLGVEVVDPEKVAADTRSLDPVHCTACSWSGSLNDLPV